MLLGRLTHEGVLGRCELRPRGVQALQGLAHRLPGDADAAGEPSPRRRPGRKARSTPSHADAPRPGPEGVPVRAAPDHGQYTT
ncbi:hypothetical protein GCM10010269_66730 [Streptomyces humidus]|uniref:Uncharacterized protein n=1 Tax=Streptomyces humidus TaxID=52259 RepID=A0A918G5Z0_9ACTN|nr:hypothetical protein GCM10010269_66730 [Streptomyces humidus]